jgi:hypothetical protein
MLSALKNYSPRRFAGENQIERGAAPETFCRDAVIQKSAAAR